ncbi:MAG: trehalose-6-phosphate synthase [Chloroflexi bacterium]|nr:trehalose-6-phosphate synthase [Chloroflexota bacterium]
MNLVAKEHIASRLPEDGVGILSEFAGVVRQLPEAPIANPHSQEDIAAVIEPAPVVTKEEQRRRMTPMRNRIRAEPISWWAGEFLEPLSR